MSFAEQTALLDLLTRSYGMAAPHIQLVVNGVNRTYAVTGSDGTSFYLRIYRMHGRTRQDIDAELAVLQAVRCTAILNVAKPVPAHTGACSLSLLLDGEIRTIALFEAVPGCTPALTPASLARIGRALADLHAQSHLTDLAPTRCFADSGTIAADLQALSAHPRGCSNAASILSAALASLQDQSADDAIMPTGFCHGDARLANMSLTGDQISLFDFDDCGCGPQWFDLATLGWWFERTEPEKARTLWQALLGGYGVSENPVFDLAIRRLMVIHQLRSLRFLIDYTTMAEKLWNETLADAACLATRAATGKLCIQN